MLYNRELHVVEYLFIRLTYDIRVFALSLTKYGHY